MITEHSETICRGQINSCLLLIYMLLDGIVLWISQNMFFSGQNILKKQTLIAGRTNYSLSNNNNNNNNTNIYTGIDTSTCNAVINVCPD